MSVTVNQLTSADHVLLVIAAGNVGPSDETVGSPGSATDALTVGAVDGTDRLADFSSRGPRLGDYAINPEIAAPGVDIVERGRQAPRWAARSMPERAGSRVN